MKELLFRWREDHAAVATKGEGRDWLLQYKGNVVAEDEGGVEGRKGMEGRCRKEGGRAGESPLP